MRYEDLQAEFLDNLPDPSGVSSYFHHQQRSSIGCKVVAKRITIQLELFLRAPVFSTWTQHGIMRGAVTQVKTDYVPFF
jgi:hypothetical protein